MRQDDIIGKLKKLAQLDIDAIHAYDHAVENIDTPEIKNAMLGFRQDHFRHVENLSRVIAGLGGTAPAFKKDFKGHVIEGFTALRSKTGPEQALKAMRSNEKLTNSMYGEALTWPVDPAARAVIRANAEDERRHLAYIEQVLNDRSWESTSRDKRVA
ncbi:MAG: ferritin-like domain-containing protein [Oligoflexia bacterium]|nr:ferritin-like domain-containing protein [Oligoflexia bacterium]